MVIRNPATHVAEDFTEQDGLEQLARLSVLAKFVDRCVVVSIDEGTASKAEQVLPEPAGEPSQALTGEKPPELVSGSAEEFLHEQLLPTYVRDVNGRAAGGAVD